MFFKKLLCKIEKISYYIKINRNFGQTNANV